MMASDSGTVLDAQVVVDMRELAVNVKIVAGRGVPLALVGPSGAGKSTILRAIAGLVEPRSGRVRNGGLTLYDSVAGINLSPERRGVGYVPQGNALFPHMTVRANVAYGLRASRGRDAVVDTLLERFGIAQLAAVRPGALSGGEQQRVALARALARAPDVLLLDEPTSSLDVETRASVLGVIGAVVRDVGVPTIVVTHSFEDAAVLADQIVVVERGRIVQSGSAVELVSAPASAFIAGLTGMNVLRGVVDPPGPDAAGVTVVQISGGQQVASTSRLATHGPVSVLVAPSDIVVDIERPGGSALNVLSGTIESLLPVGEIVRLRVGGLTAEVTRTAVARLELQSGKAVWLSFKATSTRVIPAS